MCFVIFWSKENAFLGYKNKKFKKSKNWDFFSKRLDYSFGPKFAIFPSQGQENVFYGIPERNNAFLGYKNIKLEKSKNWHFS